MVAGAPLGRLRQKEPMARKGSHAAFDLFVHRNVTFYGLPSRWLTNRKAKRWNTFLIWR